MLNNFSRYYNTRSLIHDLSPLCKILTAFIFVMMVSFSSDFKVLFSLFIVSLFVIIISNIPFNKFLDSIWSMKVLYFSVLVINLLFGISLYDSLIMVSKICLIVMYSSVLLFSTTTSELALGFSSLLKPLSVFNFPVLKVSMGISLAINFIPVLFLEANKIMKSQASRGFDYNSKNFKDKIVGIKSIFIPMFISSIKRADRVSDAFLIKQFSFDNDRSHVKNLGWKFSDSYMILCHLIILTFVLVKEVVL